MTAPVPSVTTHRLARTSVLIGLGTLLSRITGFLRVSALAALGFARVTDVYNVANSTPNIVYELLLGGILTATLVPLFVESHERGERDATDAINTISIALLILGTAVGIFAAPWIARAYGIGGRNQQQLATELLRWFMPQMFFYGMASLAIAMLNARRRFAAAAFAPALNNVMVIATLIAVGRAASAPITVRSVLDDPALVALLGVGTTAGVMAFALVLLPALRRAGTGFRWRWAPKHPAVRRLARLSGWTIGYVIANQVAFFVVLVLAYRSRSDVSVYLAAFAFFQLPHGLFAVSVMTALGPELASRHQAGDLEGVREHFSTGLRLLTMVMIPATVGLAVLARPLIRALLDHGDFAPASVAQTADTVRAFAFGLVAFSVYLFVIRTFTSMQDTRTPFVLNLIENGLNIATAFALYEWRGVEGLAWSWTVAYSVASIVGLATLRRRLHRLDGVRLASTAIRVVAAAVPAAFIGHWLTTIVGSVGPAPSVLTVIGGGGVISVVFVVALRIAGISAIRGIREVLRPTHGAATPADA